jgi:hypothetical protein
MKGPPDAKMGIARPPNGPVSAYARYPVGASAKKAEKERIFEGSTTAE